MSSTPGDLTPPTHMQEDLSRDFYLSRAPRDATSRPTLGGIPLLRRLGRGGMGAVYFGIHPRLNCAVAVKVLSPELLGQDPGLAARFTAEARLAARIRSPHVVQTFDVHADEDTHYCVMEFVDGETAAALVKQRGGLPEIEALEILAAAARGLADAHGAGVIHRDIKPENILIPRINGTLDPSRAKLLDLGLAKPEGQAATVRTMANVAMGTPGYLAPEQARDARSAGKPADVFSMGATLYALLTGQAPFSGSSLGTILADTESKPHPPVSTRRPDISRATADLVDRCLEKDPARRYSDGQSLLQAICLVRNGVAPAALPTLIAPTLRPPAAPSRGVSGLLIAGGAVLAAAAVVVLVLWLLIHRKAPDPTPVTELARARALAKTDLKGAIALLDSILLDAGGTPLEEEVRKLRISWGRVLNERVTLANLMTQASESESAGRFDEALAAITQAEAVDPSHAGVLEMKARLQARLRESTGTDQRRTEARRALAWADRIRKRAGHDPAEWQRVVDSLERAIALAEGEDLKLAQESRAEALQKRDQLAAAKAEAEGDLEQALSLAKQAAAHREPTQELREYVAFLDEAISTRKDAARRRDEFADLVRQAGELPPDERALKLWQRAHTIAPDESGRATAAARIGEIEKALAERSRAADFEDALERGDSALANSQYREARAAYEEALRLKAGDPAAMDGLARVDNALASLGIEDRRKLEDDAEVRASSSLASIEDAERMLAEAHRALEAGVDAKALSSLKQVFYAYPDRMTGAAAAYRLASEYARASDRDRALDWLEIALRRDPKRLEDAPRAFAAWKSDPRFLDIVRRGEMALGTAGKRRRHEDRALLAEPLPTAEEAHLLFSQAYDLLVTRAKYVDAIREFKRIFYAVPDTADGVLAAYNVACAAALMGQYDAALDWLEISVLHGLMQQSDSCHESMAHHARADNDLKNLWKLERFDRIVRGAVRPFGDSLGGFRPGSWCRITGTRKTGTMDAIVHVKEVTDTTVLAELRVTGRPPEEQFCPRISEPIGEERLTIAGRVFDCRVERAQLLLTTAKLWVCREGPDAELIALRIDDYKATGVSREDLRIGSRTYECIRVDFRKDRGEEPARTLAVWFCRHVPLGIARLVEGVGEADSERLDMVEVHEPGVPIPELASPGRALVKDLRAAYEKAASIRFSGRIKNTTTRKEGGSEEATVEFAGVIAGGRFRVQQRELVDGEPEVETIICDGKRIERQGGDEPGVKEAPAGAAARALEILVMLGAPIPDMMEAFDDEELWDKLALENFVNEDPQTLGERECRVVSFTHKLPGDDGTTVSQRLWIDRKTGLIVKRRWESETAGDKFVSEESYEITVDGPVKDDEFRVKEPPK